MKLLFVVIILLFFLKNSNAQFNNYTVSQSPVKKYEKLEISFDYIGNYLNPFDSKEIIIRCELKAPSGKSYRIDAYYEKGADLFSYNCPRSNAKYLCEKIIPNNNNKWKVRFSPNEEGEWVYYFHIFENNNILIFPKVGILKFTCSPSASKGFIRRANNAYFKFDDNSIFIPIGQNIGWYFEPQGYHYTDVFYGTNQYKDIFKKMNANGANFARIWIDSYWAICLICHDWNYNSLYIKEINYRKAKQIDKIIELAEENGIYLQICIFASANYQQFGDANCMTLDGNWKKSPYNSTNGGELTNHLDFFKYPSKSHFLQREIIRYAISRWGYSSHLMGWELFNEVDFFPKECEKIDNSYYASVINWHTIMTNFIVGQDPYKHPIIASFGKYDDNRTIPLLPIFDLKNIDFIQTHHYNDILSSYDFQKSIFIESQYLKLRCNKPFAFGETGYTWGDDNKMKVFDPHGYEYHCEMWQSFFSGCAGPAVFWSWNSIENQNLYSQYLPFSKFIKQLSATKLITNSKNIPKNIRSSFKEIYYIESANSYFDTPEIIMGWVQDIRFSTLHLLKDKVDPSNNYYIMNLNKDQLYSQPFIHSSFEIEYDGNPRPFKVDWFSTETGDLIKSEYIVAKIKKGSFNPIYKKCILEMKIPAEFKASKYGDAVFIIQK